MPSQSCLSSFNCANINDFIQPALHSLAPCTYEFPSSLDIWRGKIYTPEYNRLWISSNPLCGAPSMAAFMRWNLPFFQLPTIRFAEEDDDNDCDCRHFKAAATGESWPRIQLGWRQLQIIETMPMFCFETFWKLMRSWPKLICSSRLWSVCRWEAHRHGPGAAGDLKRQSLRVSRIRRILPIKSSTENCPYQLRSGFFRALRGFM